MKRDILHEQKTRIFMVQVTCQAYMHKIAQNLN